MAAYTSRASFTVVSLRTRSSVVRSAGSSRRGLPTSAAAAFASGTSNNTMPRLVLAVVQRRVASTAALIVTPSGSSATRLSGSPIAIALVTKSSNETSRNACPGETLPGLGAAASSTHASWAAATMSPI
jgi:hypothetical protein